MTRLMPNFSAVELHDRNTGDLDDHIRSGLLRTIHELLEAVACTVARCTNFLLQHVRLLEDAGDAVILR